VRQAHETICPYSHVTRGNAEVAFEVIGVAKENVAWETEWNNCNS
jgi:hypothetical protein